MSLMLSTMKRMPEKATFASMNLSGGETGICADVGSLNGIEYPDFTEETLKKLKEQLPSYASPNNPLDMTQVFLMMQTSMQEHFGRLWMTRISVWY